MDKMCSVDEELKGYDEPKFSAPIVEEIPSSSSKLPKAKRRSATIASSRKRRVKKNVKEKDNVENHNKGDKKKRK
jgi:hypothetical protein